MNIQSLVPKIDLIQAKYSGFDILAVIETWSDINHKDESIKLLSYPDPNRRDRVSHKKFRRTDIYIYNLEEVLLDFKFNENKSLLGIFL